MYDDYDDMDDYLDDLDDDLEDDDLDDDFDFEEEMIEDNYQMQVDEIDEYWDRENGYIINSGIYTEEEVQQILELCPSCLHLGCRLSFLEETHTII